MSKYGEDVTVSLTGISMGVETGSLSPNISVPLTGQQITIEQGFLSAQTLITLIDKSWLSSTKKIIVFKIIDELADEGIIKAKELFSKICDAFPDDTVTVDCILDIIKSILQS
jgi:hypothetical protein